MTDKTRIRLATAIIAGIAVMLLISALGLPRLMAMAR